MPPPDLHLHTPLSATAFLPGGAASMQDRYTLTLHTPGFGNLASVRRNLRARLENWNIDPACIGTFELTATEILTNLIKHPLRKALMVQVTLRRNSHELAIDVSDNATTFDDFVAKCNDARAEAPDKAFINESGHGLCCILKLHDDVTYVSAAQSPDQLNHFIAKTTLSAPLSASVRTPEKQPASLKRTGKPVVYLVDNNTATLSMHMQMLEEEYIVCCFEYAVDALSSFTKDAPSVVIADVALPDMDGMSFRHQLSATPNGNQTPFVFLTAHIERSKERDANLTGIDDFLCRPVSRERLLSVIARLIRRSNQIASSVHGSFDHKINGMLHPELPRRASGWNIATRSSRAEAGGGDFILYQQTEDRTFAVIADVMGHGRDAKFFACAYAGYLRSFVQVLGATCSPGAFLSKISAAIFSDSFFDTAVMTCLAFELQNNGRIRVATAGHPPPSLCRRRSDGATTAIALDITGPLPGLVTDADYADIELQLDSGDRLLMATDGYWNIEEGRISLHRALVAASHANLERGADFLWQAHVDHSSASKRHQDDTTLIILEAGDAT